MAEPRYIADLTEKAALVEADSIPVGDSTVTGAGSGKRHSPKQSATVSSLVLRTATGQVKAVDAVEADDAVTLSQQESQAVLNTRLARALADNPSAGDGSLLMDFANNAFATGVDDGIETPVDLLALATFVRSSVKNAYDGRGLLKEFAANELASPTYDPETGEKLGADIEPSATNLQVFNNDYTNAAWKRNGAATVIESATPFPSTDPSIKFFLLDSASLTTDYISYNFSFSGIGTASIYVKANAADSACRVSFIDNGIGRGFQYNFATETFSNINGVTINEKEVIGDVVRISFTYDFVGTTNVRIAGRDCLIALYQFESGKVATTPIVTGASPIVRDSDQLSIENIDTLPLWNPSEGTFVVEFQKEAFGGSVFGAGKIPASGAARRGFDLSTPAQNALNLVGGNFGLQIRDSLGNFDTVNLGIPIPLGSKNKAAIAFSDNEILVSINGSAVISVAVPNGLEISSYKSLTIGSALTSGGIVVTGASKNSKTLYYPNALSDAELQTKSTL